MAKRASETETSRTIFRLALELAKERGSTDTHEVVSEFVKRYPHLLEQDRDVLARIGLNVLAGRATVKKSFDPNQLEMFPEYGLPPLISLRILQGNGSRKPRKYSVLDLTPEIFDSHVSVEPKKKNKSDRERITEIIEEIKATGSTTTTIFDYLRSQ